MEKAEKYFKLVIPAMLFAAASAFFGIAYPFHICYQEQFQLFEFTSEYFLSTVSVPGGLSDWLGLFLTQFFLYGWAGAAITASLVTLLYLLCTWVARGKSLISRTLLIIPTSAFFVFLTDERALAGALIAVSATLATVLFIRKSGSRRTRSALVIICTPVLYWICGPVAVILPIIGAKDIHPAAFASAVIIAAASPFAASLHLHYGIRALAFGVHYFRYATVIPKMLWIAVFLTAVTCLLPDIRLKKRTPELLLWGICLIAVVAASVKAVGKAADFKKEEMMAYDYMSRFQMWDGIVSSAKEKQPDRPLSVSCLNLALSQTGRMTEDMFKFYQNGTAGLFPPFSRVFTTPLSTAEIFWHLGLVNAAQHFTFEAQEAIPDFHKSGRCYRRLAETNLVNGDYEVAAKYLNALSHTLFYRKWAENTASLLGDETAIDAHPLYGKLRKMRVHEEDGWFKDTAVDSVLVDIVTEQPDNCIAKDYLLAWYLLDCNLDAFAKHFDSSRQGPAAKTYQEAYLMYMIDHQVPIENAPSFVEEATAERFLRFIKDVQKGQAKAFITRTYGDTYWYYALYRR